MNVDLRVVYDSIRRGEWQDAELQCRRLLLEGGDTAAVHHALGLSLCGTGAYEQAIGPLTRAAELDRTTAVWARDAAALYAKLDRWRDALTVLIPVVPRLDADGLAVYLTAAIETKSAGSIVEALPAEAILTVREDADALCAYGRALLAAAKYAEAEAALTDCITRFGDVPDARIALARVFEATERGEGALEQLRLAAQAQTDDTRAQLRLAVACGDRGLWEECRAVRKHAESLGLDDPEDHASRLYMMLSDPYETAETILAAARSAFAGVRPVGVDRPLRRRRRAGERMRIGYLSGGFVHTPSFYFIYPFLTAHDRSIAEVFFYHLSAPVDFSATTVSSAAVGEHYKEVGHLNDAELAAVLKHDSLDVLVHMAGHFTYSGLRLLCERLAPVQISYPHFPATTGCPGVDYVITDRWTSPPGSDGEYSERLYRVPTGCLAFAAPENGPSVTPVPMLTRRHATFGIFQRMAKFNAPFFDAVAAVLNRVPDSRLFIHNGDAELDRPGSATVRTLIRRFERLGIDPARLDFRGPLGYHEHLHITGHVDVALDSFPYNGQTMTCEALWMGVPVITMRGGTHVGRVTAALLARTGYQQWIAGSADEYADIAAALVADVDGLAALRQRLRTDFIQAGLTDGRTLARSLETAYQAMS
jgi:predicted O-linked N-acetylglucosamine transferase (SPINDLY family)